jgi:hypothetical protein
MRRAKRGVKKLSQPRELQQHGTTDSLDQGQAPERHMRREDHEGYDAPSGAKPLYG